MKVTIGARHPDRVEVTVADGKYVYGIELHPSLSDEEIHEAATRHAENEAANRRLAAEEEPDRVAAIREAQASAELAEARAREAETRAREAAATVISPEQLQVAIQSAVEQAVANLTGGV